MWCSRSIDVSSAVLLLNGKGKVANKLPSLQAEDGGKIEEVNKNKCIRGLHCSTANLHPTVNGCSHVTLQQRCGNVAEMLMGIGNYNTDSVSEFPLLFLVHFVPAMFFLCRIDNDVLRVWLVDY